MENKTDIEKALKRFRHNQIKYRKYERYYDGDHDLAFATDKFKNAFGKLFREFALNLCPAVCDAVKDKLIIENFSVEEGNKNLPVEAWKIWQNNRMGKRSGEVHKEATIFGDAYVQVWVDPAGRTTIYPQKAVNCTVFYDEETPGKILWGAKYWRTTDKKIRINLYYADKIIKYISKRVFKSGIPSSASDLVEYTADGTAEVNNPYGIVPMFHFGNNTDTGSFGRSELKDAIPVQDALNKSVLDMMVAMEFASYRQRWAAGIEIEYDDDGKPIPPFQAGIERLWTTEAPDTKFGTFDATDLEQFLKVKKSFGLDMAGVTRTPMWYFVAIGGDFPSGEALKKSETPFINKVDDRMTSFGQVWEDVMAFVLLMENKGKDIRLFAEWADPEPLSEKENLENIRTKQDIGISDEQALIEAGYGETDIARMMEENEAKTAKMVNAFNAGETLEDE